MPCVLMKHLGTLLSYWRLYVNLSDEVRQVVTVDPHMSPLCPPTAVIMSSVLQKLITPLASCPTEPPRNKVTVVGVGQVGMACAISILLRVRHNHSVAQW